MVETETATETPARFGSSRAGAAARGRYPLSRMLRALVLLMPLLVVVVVGCAWVFVRPPERWTTAKVYGHRMAEQLLIRAQLLSVEHGRVHPLSGPLRLNLRPGGPEVSLMQREAEAGDDGVAAFEVLEGERLREGSWLTLESGDRELQLLVAGSVPAFDEGRCDTGGCGARSVGGIVEGVSRGDLQIQVGVVRGVLAVPHPAQIDVAVARGDGSLSNAHVVLRVNGASFAGQSSKVVVDRTDEAGRVRRWLVPDEHVVELTVLAFPDVPSDELSALLDGLEAPRGGGRFYGRLPVVAGASHAEVRNGRLLVASPVPRARLYVDLFEAGRPLLSTTVTLEPEAELWSGQLELPRTLRDLERAHALVSSEPDMQAMALVGWPLGTKTVQSTFERRMELLLDGVAIGQRRQLEHNRRLRVGVVVLVSVAALLEVVLFWVVERRTAARVPMSQLRAPRRPAWSLLVTSLLLTGFLGLSALLLW